ncbi:MAG TPA: cellulose synthase operon protein YhjQ/BcsQ, partial [Edaphobacter sp.]|nr:cellulose synthase operon protein YhjQ/BcsQ [Edaphobacter sp.]
MGPHDKDFKEDRDALEPSGETRARYSWEDLHGIKYRDFSISRRESRAQSRVRATQQVRERAMAAHEGEESLDHSSSAMLDTHYEGVERRRVLMPTHAVHSSSASTTLVDEDLDFETQRGSASEIPSALPPAYIAEPEMPAWLRVDPAPAQPSVADTLQQSRERLASRWYALKSAFESAPEESAPARQKEIRTPVLAVFSLAGGVGKTSLVATLGRALSSMGEKVLLTDTSSHGLLPFYFGASELRPGVVRTFTPPSGSTDSPIYLV